MTSAERGYRLVLKAYLDASGKPAEHPVIVVAGFVAGEATWEAFDEVWGEFLDKYDLKRFHCAPYCARERPYNTWSDEKYAAAFDDICQIFREARLLGSGIGLNVAAFREWRGETSALINPDPYYTALDWALRPLIRGIAELNKPDVGITIYCDQEEDHEFLGVSLAKWHQDFLRRAPAHEVLGLSPERAVEMHYGSSFKHRPLQLADILCHTSFQMMRDSTADPVNWPRPRFYDCLNQTCALSVRTLYDKSAITKYAEHVAQLDRKRAGNG